MSKCMYKNIFFIFFIHVKFYEHFIVSIIIFCVHSKASLFSKATALHAIRRILMFPIGDIKIREKEI